MPVQIEGMTSNEILALPSEHLDELVFTGQPIVFRVGTAEILGEFRISASTLSIDLAHIVGGGEGALLAVVSLAERLARARELRSVEWLVRATNCARPNPKLRRVLVRRGFAVRTVPGRGECFYKVVPVAQNLSPSKQKL